MIDARRMEVYTAVFDQALNQISGIEAKIIDGSSFADLLADNRIVFFGDGAEKCRSVLDSNKNAEFLTEFVNSAKHMSELSFIKFQKEKFEDVAYFEPYYLKDFLVTTPKAGKV
jgi:tRNA threonylcarbamoyladenosine biosynthesis protein TsaB